MARTFAENLHRNTRVHIQQYLFNFRHLLPNRGDVLGKSERYLEAQLIILAQQFLGPTDPD